jgi:hypothetical protein
MAQGSISEVLEEIITGREFANGQQGSIRGKIKLWKMK